MDAPELKINKALTWWLQIRDLRLFQDREDEKPVGMGA
jgi:hypothetical protein